jgi:hypothetical protein
MAAHSCIVVAGTLALVGSLFVTRPKLCGPSLLHHATEGADGAWADPEVWSNAAVLVPAAVAAFRARGRPVPWALAATLVILAAGSTYFHRVQHTAVGARGLLVDRVAMALVFAVVAGAMGGVVWPGCGAIVAVGTLGLLLAGALDCHADASRGLLWPLMQAVVLGTALLWWLTVPAVRFDPWIGGTLLLVALANVAAIAVPTRQLLGMSGHSWKHVLYAAALALFAVWATR